MDLDLRQLLQIARRRWWIVLLLMLVAGGAAYVSADRQTRQYSATATMLLSAGSASSTTGVDVNALRATELLAETYRKLIESNDMQRRIAEQVGLEEIPGSLTASIVDGSQLIDIRVTDTDPERAALIANTAVTEFQEYVSEQAQADAENARSSIDTQIEALEAQVAEIDSQLAELNSRPNSDDDPETQRAIEDLTEARASLRDQLVELNSNAATIGAQTMAASGRVSQAGVAEVPDEPFEPRPMRSALLGLFVGLLLGVGLVALLEFMDNTVKPERNIQELAHAPLLASIANLPKLQPGGGQVYSMTQPRSGSAEAIRLLRTNLEFASASGDISRLVITSPNPGEGKSTVAANLGVVMAQGGTKTVVIDADLRKPTQHRIFGVPNDQGLTTLMTHPERSWEEVAKKVALPGLMLIPSGPLPPNPADLVSSERFSELLDQLREEADLVIIDSPPVLSASDSLAIARYTDGVLVVCRANQTRIEALQATASSIHQGGIRLVGVVLNRLKGQQGAAYYYGEYYGTASPSSEQIAGD